MFFHATERGDFPLLLLQNESVDRPVWLWQVGIIYLCGHACIIYPCGHVRPVHVVTVNKSLLILRNNTVNYIVFFKISKPAAAAIFWYL